MKPVQLVLTSVDTQQTALNIAHTLTAQKLAACVQVSSKGTSVYVWQGKIQQTKEYYIHIKTDTVHAKAVVDWLEENHPYDTPEIITVQAEANQDYYNWLSKALDD